MFFDYSASATTQTFYSIDATGNVLAVYEYFDDGIAETYTLQESHIYAGKRLGVYQRNIDLITPPSETTLSRILGDKRYELSNHLGNVLQVISDRLLTIDVNTDDVTDYYSADVISWCDYTPFGATMPGRSGSASSYKYGFQGQEKDNEIKGNGNSVNYKYRMHDPRVGRFFAVDPLAPKYPYYSPYSFSGNRVIDMIELEGLEPTFPGTNQKLLLDLYYDYTLWGDNNPTEKVVDMDLFWMVNSTYRQIFGKRGGSSEFLDETGEWESGWRKTDPFAKKQVEKILGHSGLSMTQRPTDAATEKAAKSGTYVMGIGVRTQNGVGIRSNDWTLVSVEKGQISKIIAMTRGDCESCDFNINFVIEYSTKVTTGIIQMEHEGKMYNVSYEKTTVTATYQDYNNESQPTGKPSTYFINATYKVTGIELIETNTDENG